MKSIVLMFCLSNFSMLCQTKQDSVLEGANLLNLKQANLNTYYKYNLTPNCDALLKFKNGKVVDYIFNSLTKTHLKVDTFIYSDKSGIAITVNKKETNPRGELRISNDRDDSYLDITVMDTTHNYKSNNYYLYYSNKQLQSIKLWSFKDHNYTIKKYNKDGTLEGETIEDSNGNLIKVTVYNEKGKFSFRRWAKDYITISELYDKKGNLMQKDTTNAELKFIGSVVQYYPNGVLKTKMPFTDGLIDGIYYTYYENGAFKTIETYILGNKAGRYAYYNKNGTIKKEGVYNKK